MIQCTLASSFLYPAMMSTVRISVLLFYRRLIGPAYRSLQYCIKVLILLTIPYVVAYELLLGFMCKPPSSFWKPFQRNLDCGDVYYYKLHISLYSVSLAFDVLILVLPMKPLWELKLPLRQRVMVCILIGLGASYVRSGVLGPGSNQGLMGDDYYRACFGIAYRLTLWILEMKRYPYIDPRCKLALSHGGRANTQTLRVRPPPQRSHPTPIRPLRLDILGSLPP